MSMTIDPYLLTLMANNYIRMGVDVNVAKAFQHLLKQPIEDRTLEEFASQNTEAARYAQKYLGYVLPDS